MWRITHPWEIPSLGQMEIGSPVHEDEKTLEPVRCTRLLYGGWVNIQNKIEQVRNGIDWREVDNNTLPFIYDQESSMYISISPQPWVPGLDGNELCRRTSYEDLKEKQKYNLLSGVLVGPLVDRPSQNMEYGPMYEQITSGYVPWPLDRKEKLGQQIAEIKSLVSIGNYHTLGFQPGQTVTDLKFIFPVRNQRNQFKNAKFGWDLGASNLPLVGLWGTGEAEKLEDDMCINELNDGLFVGKTTKSDGQKKGCCVSYDTVKEGLAVETCGQPSPTRRYLCTHQPQKYTREVHSKILLLLEAIRLASDRMVDLCPLIRDIMEGPLWASEAVTPKLRLNMIDGAVYDDLVNTVQDHLSTIQNLMWRIDQDHNDFFSSDLAGQGVWFNMAMVWIFLVTRMVRSCLRRRQKKRVTTRDQENQRLGERGLAV